MEKDNGFCHLKSLFFSLRDTFWCQWVIQVETAKAATQKHNELIDHILKDQLIFSVFNYPLATSTLRERPFDRMQEKDRIKQVFN